MQLDVIKYAHAEAITQALYHGLPVDATNGDMIEVLVVVIASILYRDDLTVDQVEARCQAVDELLRQAMTQIAVTQDV